MTDLDLFASDFPHDVCTLLGAITPDRAFEFDLRRDPNPHLGSDHGVHHCPGANLARLEIRVVLDGLCARVGSLELTRPVKWTRSNKDTGVRHLPVRMTRKD